MKAEKYLSQIRRLEKMIDVRIRDLEVLRARATNISPKLTEDKVQTSIDQYKISTIVSEIVDKESDIDTLKRKRGLIMAQIEGMEDLNEFYVLSDRYIMGMTFNSISEDIDKSPRYCMKIHKRALTNFENKYLKTE